MLFVMSLHSRGLVATVMTVEPEVMLAHSRADNGLRAGRKGEVFRSTHTSKDDEEVREEPVNFEAAT